MDYDCHEQVALHRCPWPISGPRLALTGGGGGTICDVSASSL